MVSSPSDLETFRSYVRNVDLQNDASFAETIRRACDVLGMSEGDFASGMRISRPTAARWKNGVTSPAPGMREGLRRFLLKKIEVVL